MRTLILILMVANTSAFASSGKIKASVLSDEIISLNEENIKSKSHSISVISPEIESTSTITINLLQFHQDLKNRNLVGENGQEIPISKIDNGQKSTLTFAIDNRFKNHLVSLAVSNDVNKTVFSRKSCLLSDQISIYSGATLINLSFQKSDQDQPLSYFINPGNAKSEKRAQSIKNQITSVGIEQIWTSVFKTRFDIQKNMSFEYRPDQMTYKLSQAYAASDRITYKSELGFSIDNREQKLSEDRGYFKTQWYDQELTYEYELDSFVGIGWSTIYETEVDPRRSQKTNLGTDDIGFMYEKAFNQFTVQIAAFSLMNSESQKRIKFSGELTWIF